MKFETIERDDLSPLWEALFERFGFDKAFTTSDVINEISELNGGDDEDEEDSELNEAVCDFFCECAAEGIITYEDMEKSYKQYEITLPISDDVLVEVKGTYSPYFSWEEENITLVFLSAEEAAEKKRAAAKEWAEEFLKAHHDLTIEQALIDAYVELKD